MDEWQNNISICIDWGFETKGHSAQWRPGLVRGGGLRGRWLIQETTADDVRRSNLARWWYTWIISKVLPCCQNIFERHHSCFCFRVPIGINCCFLVSVLSVNKHLYQTTGEFSGKKRLHNDKTVNHYDCILYQFYTFLEWYSMHILAQCFIRNIFDKAFLWLRKVYQDSNPEFRVYNYCQNYFRLQVHEKLFWATTNFFQTLGETPSFGCKGPFTPRESRSKGGKK